jgi:hypothetical protein
MEHTVKAVQVACWGLRAQWESALRTLTAVQTNIDSWRLVESGTERAEALVVIGDRSKPWSTRICLCGTYSTTFAAC